jgi:hypothetical protein
MDVPNAFIGHAAQPTPAEVRETLGKTADLWEELLTIFPRDLCVPDQEWKSTSPKYGWSLLLKLKKRTIVYLGPCAECFRVSFVLGDRAVSAARTAGLSKSLLKIIDDAPRYAEGTGIRVLVKTGKDLPGIRKLAEIKLAN